MIKLSLKDFVECKESLAQMSSFSLRTYFLLFSLLVSQSLITHALPESLETSVTVSAQVLLTLAPSYPLYDKPTNPLSGVPITIEAGSEVVLLRGTSYPNSIVSILKNGIVVDRVLTNNEGFFSSSLRDLNTGTYTFSVRAEIPGSGSTDLQSFSVVVTTGITTVIDNILIAPTLAIDKSEVRFGDYITLSGKGAPNQVLQLYIISSEDIDTVLHFTTKLSGSGEWSYTLKSTDISLGDYTVHVRSENMALSSPRSSVQKFRVGDKNVYIGIRKISTYYCDINNDSFVNLFDFSIMAFWYKRYGFPPNVDLSRDESIDLVDFSILAYCWTG